VVNQQEVILSLSEKIIEGRVTRQESFLDSDGKIFTRNEVAVYRVFKGEVPYTIEVITEGGKHGNTLQIITPSTQLRVGDYGLLTLGDGRLGFSEMASSFIAINPITERVSSSELATNREALYEKIANVLGTNVFEMKRISEPVSDPRNDALQTLHIDQIEPLQMTAGTRSEIIITGSGFGNEQGTGTVAFRNADDGGLSFVEIAAGAHYLSWSDEEIRLYVPASSLFGAKVAGSGTVRIQNSDGGSAESIEQIMVQYAKSEVIYSDLLNETRLVGIENGGYVFTMNQNLQTLLGSSEMVQETVKHWTCLSGVNFRLGTEVSNLSDWVSDGINLIGMSMPNQLPNYILGKTVTTFSGCGTPTETQWNLVEVDIILNSSLNWWTSEQPPATNSFDLHSVILHELGHAHLLQHNNNSNSPMYFRLTAGSNRRILDPVSDVQGGAYVVAEAVNATNICGAQVLSPNDFSNCQGLVNGLADDRNVKTNIHPNPFSNRLNIVSNSGGANYQLTDISGRILKYGILNAGQTILATAALPNGMYLLTISDKQVRSTVKLIKN